MERPRVVTVGLDASPPVPLHTGHPGEGFEVDLLQAVADRIGVSVRYESALWREIVERLVRHELDMVCSAATITEERRQLVDFSIPYLDFPFAIVVHAEGPPIQSPADFGRQGHRRPHRHHGRAVRPGAGPLTGRSHL